MKRRSFLGLLAAVPALRLLPSAPAAEVAAAPSVPAPGAYAVAVDWARDSIDLTVRSSGVVMKRRQPGLSWMRSPEVVVVSSFTLPRHV